MVIFLSMAKGRKDLSIILVIMAVAQHQCCCQTRIEIRPACIAFKRESPAGIENEVLSSDFDPGGKPMFGDQASRGIVFNDQGEADFAFHV